MCRAFKGTGIYHCKINYKKKRSLFFNAMIQDSIGQDQNPEYGQKKERRNVLSFFCRLQKRDNLLLKEKLKYDIKG